MKKKYIPVCTWRECAWVVYCSIIHIILYAHKYIKPEICLLWTTMRRVTYSLNPYTTPTNSLFIPSTNFNPYTVHCIQWWYYNHYNPLDWIIPFLFCRNCNFSFDYHVKCFPMTDILWFSKLNTTERVIVYTSYILDTELMLNVNVCVLSF